MSTFTCPFNVEVVTTRTCTTGGSWLPFNEDACQTFSGQLNDLLDLFTNVRQNYGSFLNMFHVINCVPISHVADNGHI